MTVSLSLNSKQFMGNLKMGSGTNIDELHLTQIENRQLKETINTLRQALEKSEIGQKENIQKALADAGNEIEQLKATIITLRETLESNKAKFEDKIQELGRSTLNEINQLRETIVNLRQQLENHDAKH